VITSSKACGARTRLASDVGLDTADAAPAGVFGVSPDAVAMHTVDSGAELTMERVGASHVTRAASRRAER
jgi:hypothetical protein